MQINWNMSFCRSGIPLWSSCIDNYCLFSMAHLHFLYFSLRRMVKQEIQRQLQSCLRVILQLRKNSGCYVLCHMNQPTTLTLRTMYQSLLFKARNPSTRHNYIKDDIVPVVHLLALWSVFICPKLFICIQAFAHWRPLKVSLAVDFHSSWSGSMPTVHTDCSVQPVSSN